MPREKEFYRETLQRLDVAFPGQELLTKQQIADYLGCSVRTVYRRYGFPRGLINKMQVAKAIC